MIDSWQYASELIAENTGGFGYLLKDRVADVEDFLAAVEEVAGGGTVLDPEVVSRSSCAHARRTDCPP